MAEILTYDDKMPSYLNEGMAAEEDESVEWEVKDNEEVGAEGVFLELILGGFLEQ